MHLSASIAAVSEAQKEARAAMAAARRWKLLAIGTVSVRTAELVVFVVFACMKLLPFLV